METYRVGECFYYEESDKQPYQIRRISELGRSATGEPEIKVVRFLRKTDLPPKLAGELEVDDDVTLLHLASDDVEELSARELFLCQDVETVPVSQIRGRCTVAQHIGVLPLTSYLNKEDSFLQFGPGRGCRRFAGGSRGDQARCRLSGGYPAA